MTETVGDRIALIRVAIGGSIRDQISQEALGELVGWDKYKVSRIERGAQPLSRDDAIELAKVDPLKRGPAWVMFGDENGGSNPARLTGPPLRPLKDNRLPMTPTQPSRVPEEKKRKRAR